ncbi:MerR family DNA-binding transcriptional regulator [Nonomuraea deserti]|uniref:helix-turn-helix domain-containing protein n=1 Tax=Nonomuraea deserti TaxID=1848322 RepID=UPI003F6DD023
MAAAPPYRLSSEVVRKMDGSALSVTEGEGMAPPGSGGDHLHIGQVAARTGLSLRTIRHYDEVGLVRPSARAASASTPTGSTPAGR